MFGLNNDIVTLYEPIVDVNVIPVQVPVAPNVYLVHTKFHELFVLFISNQVPVPVELVSILIQIADVLALYALTSNPVCAIALVPVSIFSPVTAYV